MGLRGVDPQPESHILQFLGAEHRRLAALEDIDEGRPAHLAPDDVQFLGGLRRLDKTDIGAGVEIGVDPIDRRREPLDRARIRAGDDHHVAVPPGIDRGLDLADHLSPADDFLSFVMAAFFRADLVLDMKAGDPGLLVFAHGADHVDGIAVAGVGIGDDRDPDRLDGAADEQHVLGQAQQAQIGVAAGAGIAAAGQIDRGETGGLDEPRGQGVIGARHHRVTALVDEAAQFLAWRHRSLLRRVREGIVKRDPGTIARQIFTAVVP